MDLEKEKLWNTQGSEEDKLIIRKAILEDLPAIHKVFTEAIGVTAAKSYTIEQVKAWQASVEQPEKWVKRIEEDYFLVAVVEEEIIGFASLQNQNYVDLLFVLSKWSRQGVASKLYRKLEQNAQNPITVHASHFSKAFFEKHGYVLEEINDLIYNDVTFENFLMRKDS